MMNLKSLLSLLMLSSIFLWPIGGYCDDFFPIGIFSVGTDGLEMVKHAGFNTAQTYFSDSGQLVKFVKKAEGLGLKTLIFPGDRGEKGKVDYERVRGFVESAKKSDSILAWYLADEPELNNASPAQMQDIHLFVKKLDPKRATSIVIHRSDRYKEYRDASDILMMDRYPVPKLSLNHIAEATRWAVTQKGDRGPVWTVLQAFGYQNSQLKGWGVPREPTYDEMRAMTFLSIIYGAKGIFYYTFTGSEYQIMKSPQHWEDLKKIVAELNRLYPLLLVPTVPHYNAPGWPDYGSVKVDIIEGPQRDDNGLLPVHIAEKQLMKDTDKFTTGKYYIVANSTDKKVRAKFSFASASRQNVTFDVLGEGRSLSGIGGAFSDTLEPYGIHIYRTKSF